MSPVEWGLGLWGPFLSSCNHKSSILLFSHLHTLSPIPEQMKDRLVGGKEQEDSLINFRDLSGCGEGGRCSSEPSLLLVDPTFHGRGKWESEATQSALSLQF